jgi:Na+-driven multidrug efflux pump
VTAAAPAPAERASIYRLAAPLVISFWMRAAFTLVDTVYAATLGDAAVAAIGLSVPFEFLMIAVWVGLSTGLTSGVSAAIGAHQGANVDRYVRTTWKLVAFVTPVFVAMGAAIYLFAPRLHVAPDLTEAFRVYGSVLVGGSALTMFWSVIPDSIVKAHHDTRSTMWAGIISNLINVVLNTVFVFVFHWGMFGIAFSTVIGRLGGLVYALRQARRHEDRRRAAGRDADPHVDPAPARAILALAVPAAIVFSLMAAENAILNGVLVSLEHGKEAAAAFSIYYRSSVFALQPAIATGIAMLPFAARRFGERDVAGVREGLAQALRGIVLYSVLVVAPLAVGLAGPISHALAESEVTRAYAASAFRLIPIACILGAPFILCRPIFEARKRGGPGLAVATLRHVVLALPGAWLGIQVAHALGAAPVVGLIGGLLGVAGIASTIMLIWVRRELAR